MIYRYVTETLPNGRVRVVEYSLDEMNPLARPFSGSGAIYAYKFGMNGLAWIGSYRLRRSNAKMGRIAGHALPVFGAAFNFYLAKRNHDRVHDFRSKGSVSIVIRF